MPRARVASSTKPSKSSNPSLKLIAKPAPQSIFEIYINSLAPSGRSGIKSLLNSSAVLLDPNSDVYKYPWETLNFAKVSRLRAELLSLGYAVATVNLALNALRGLAKVAFNLGMFSADELARIHAVKRVRGNVVRKGRSLSRSEVRALLSAARSQEGRARKTRDGALVLLACGSGLRSAELVSLEMPDLNLESGSIHVKRGKGRKERKLYLSKAVIKALKLWLEVRGEEEGALFCRINKVGSLSVAALSKTGLAGILSNLTYISGIPKFTPHDLRRTFITRLLDCGVDINTVRQLAGHSNIATTASYDFRGEKALIRATQGLVW